ncbi:hypothetical protein JCM11251_005846 [Rhodosporidiobolus azoricus]
MDAIKTTTIPHVRLSRRHGSSTSSSSPLAEPTDGSLHLTTHHLIFEQGSSTTTDMASRKGPLIEAQVDEKDQGGVGAESEIWIPLPLLHSVTRTPSTLTGETTPLIIRTRDYTTYFLHFTAPTDVDSVWDSLKGLCGSFSTGGLENRYAFFCNHGEDKKGKGRAGWQIYDAEEEFARMGLGTRSKAWRFTTVNADFQFCPSYPAQIVVPAKISDTTLSYAVKYRSKSRIPGLVYLHWANLGSITRSSQPMVGLTQHARSIQDEKLVEAIFSSHSQHSHSLSPMGVSDRPSSPSYLDSNSNGGIVYGSSARNIIIDARPSKNAYANSVKGAGTENMAYYKNCEKEYLGIDNIHVMRSSLTGVFDALADAEAIGRLDRSALRRTGWLSHLTNILDGVLTIVRTVHINNSHALVHCSDGWDRTSQLSALPQICLDPFFRTARGLAVLIEKDWISYGHRFADRSGHVCNDRIDFVQKLGDDASTQQAFLASVTRQFAPSSHAFKETCPVFQQFLDCIYQIQRQFPERFEWNEELLRHLVRETYAGASGSFLFNSEKERADLRARERTSSVWETVFDLAENGKLSIKPQFRNSNYDPSLDDPQSKTTTADQGVLVVNPQDVKWWFELFGRSDEEMNGRPLTDDPGALPQEPTITEHKVVTSEEDDPVLHPLTAQSANLSVSALHPDSTSSPLHLSGAAPASTSRSPSPTVSVNPQQLSETVAAVQSFGWSAFQKAKKFGADAAKQLREAQAAREAAQTEAAANVPRPESGHGVEASSTASWRTVDEMASKQPSGGYQSGSGSVGGTGSFGRSAGSMWSRFSASNPWASGESPAPPARSSPSTSAFPASTPSASTYQTYQPRSARINPDGSPTSPTPYQPSFPSSASPARPAAPTPRQPSSTLSINPWESISREEAMAVPSTAVTSSAPSPAPPAPLSPSMEVAKEGASRSTDPLGVGFA